MDDVLWQAAQALSTNDPDTLERLAAEISVGSYPVGNLRETQRAASVLAAQVDAAAANLALRARILAATETYRTMSWER